MRNLEINIIAYKIPNTGNYVMCRLTSGKYIVATQYGNTSYTAAEILRIWNFDVSICERLGWIA